METSSRIKILYIGPIPPEVGGKTSGGVATHCWDLATQAHKSGYEVYVLANITKVVDNINIIAPAQRNKLVKAIYAVKVWLTIDKSQLCNFDYLTFKQKIAILYDSYLLQEIIDSIRPDLIHIHSLHSFQALSLRLLRNSIPRVITDHGFWQGFEVHSKNEHILRKVQAAANSAECVICVSEFSRSQMEKYNVGYDKEKVIIHNPISPEKLPFMDKLKVRNELKLPANKKIIFFNGLSESLKRKKIDFLINAILNDSWLRDSCKIIAIADEEALIFAEAFKTKIDISILPSQPWSKVVKFYNASDAFVMPSKSEGFSLAYEESLLAGTPIVGLHRNVVELQNLLGIYIGEEFNPIKDNIRNLSDKILKVLNTDVNREILRNRVIEKLSWEARFNDFNSIYQRRC